MSLSAAERLLAARGRILISGPSGAGKRSLAHALLHEHAPHVVLVPSYPTRAAESILGHHGAAVVVGVESFDEKAAIRVAEELRAAPRCEAAVACTTSRLADLHPSLSMALESVRIEVPPLRERTDEFAMLVAQVVSACAKRLECTVPAIADGFVETLAAWHWPGNLAELTAVVEYVLVSRQPRTLDHTLAGDMIERTRGRYGAAEPAHTSPVAAPSDNRTVFPPQLPTMRAIRRELIEEALRRTGDNQSAAARMLGLTASAVNKYLTTGSADS